MAKADGSVIIDTKIDTKGMGKGVTDLGNQFKGLGSTVKKLGVTIGSVFAVRELVRFGKESVRLGSDLQEVQNVVDVTFTTLSDHVNEFAKAAAKTAGLSETMAKRYVGTFGAMAKSFRFTEAEAYQMSTTLTQLAGDVASFYNISQDEAFTKLKAVFSGETEVLKNLGIVMTQSALDEFALRQGINMTTREMTEQQKVALRYKFVLEQLSGASGDFQRTASGWANQTRLLSLQFQQLKATIGQGLINAFTPVLQVINKVLAKLQVLASAFRQLTAALFGDASTGTSGSGVAGLADDYNSAADGAENLAGGIGEVGSAAKKANKQLLAFDELNTLADPDTGGGGGGAGGGAGGGNFDLGLDELKPPDLTGTIFDSEKIQRVADIIKKIAEYIPVMVAGLAGLKLGKFISDLVTSNIVAETLKDKIALIGKKASLIGGVTLVITGIALETKGIISAIKNGLNKINFAEIISGGGMIAGGGALIGKALGNAILGGAIGGIVAGIPMVIIGIYDAIKNGIDWLSASLIAIGATATGAGIGALIGAIGGPLGALIGLIVGLVVDLGILIYQNWDSIVAYTKEKLGVIGKWFSNLWKQIKGVWSVVADWFMDTVIDPVVNFFSWMWQRISKMASDTWDSIVKFFSPSVKWFSDLFGSIRKTVSDVFYNIGVIAQGCWEIIKKAWSIASSWFNEKVVTPIRNFFTNMWNGISSLASNTWERIKSVYSAVSGWFKSTLIDPVIGLFSNMWNGFVDGARSAWDGVKSVFSTFADWFRGIFEKAWQGIVDVFSVGGEIFVNIKDGIVSAFKKVVNSLISGINSVVSVPFNGINYALRRIRDVSILGLQPFSGIREISVPQIPYLAKGAVIPPNAPFMAMLGDQKNGTNIEAPLSTIQEALLNALEQFGWGKQEININFTGDLSELARILKPKIDYENRRIGTSLAKG